MAVRKRYWRMQSGYFITVSFTMEVGPVKQKNLGYNCDYLFTHQFIETVLFEYPQHMFWLRNKKKIIF